MDEKILKAVLSGQHDNNIRFKDLQKLLENLGFDYRVRGDHFIYYSSSICEIINIQPDGNKAKPYQVKQIRTVIQRYQLRGE